MADVAQEIIQTLEDIHNDIKSAKDTLKANNVTLESQSTSTLSSEINHVGDALKNSDSLLGFKKGEFNMEHGFIYPVNNGTCNNSNTLTVGADEYVLPKDKYNTFDFPPYLLVTDYSNNKKAFRINATSVELNDLYNQTLLPLYNSAMSYRIKDGTPGSTQYALNIIIKKDSDKIDSDGYYNFDKFVFPNINTDVYFKSDDSDTETLITKFKVRDFKYSLSYRGKDVTIKCDTLHINIDTLKQEIQDPVYHGYNHIFYTDSEFYNRNDNSDAYIIYMPNFNVVYDNFYGNSFKCLAENFVRDSSFMVQPNVQIRIDETPENLAKLREDIHIVNILRLFRIFNTAGDKQYDPNNKEFVSANKYVQEVNLDTCMSDKNMFYSLNEMYSCYFDYARSGDYKAFSVTSLKSSRKIELSDMFNYIVVDNNCYYLKDASENYASISKNTFKYMRTGDSEFSSLPIFDFDDDVLSLDTSMLSGDKKLIFNISDSSISSPILPMINLSILNNSYMQNTYNGLEIKVNNPYQANPPYYQFATAANLLASPFDAEFRTSSGEDITDIECLSAPLVYNEHIKSVKIRSKLSVLFGLGIVYQTPDASHKPTVPTKPMKFILDNNASIAPSITTSYLNNVLARGGAVGLGPYSTDELAKHYDKFVHVCINENHPKLGTYDFCKFRVPLYNLDETKKYNYSKKTWELVTALTDDSDDMSVIYTDEYIKSMITTAYNPGYDLSL